jgi:RNAse (barnase) inhibitor barstar
LQTIIRRTSMSCFSNDSVQQIDWQLFQNGWVTMYWRKELIEEHCAWLTKHAYQLHRFDRNNWFSDEIALSEIARELRFPEYFGKNLDALNDCLRDLEIPNEGGLAIVLLHYDRFAVKNPQVVYTILDVFADNARSYMLLGNA